MSAPPARKGTEDCCQIRAQRVRSEIMSTERAPGPDLARGSTRSCSPSHVPPSSFEMVRRRMERLRDSWLISMYAQYARSGKQILCCVVEGRRWLAGPHRIGGETEWRASSSRTFLLDLVRIC